MSPFSPFFPTDGVYFTADRLFARFTPAGHARQAAYSAAVVR